MAIYEMKQINENPPPTPIKTSPETEQLETLKPKSPFSCSSLLSGCFRRRTTAFECRMKKIKEPESDLPMKCVASTCEMSWTTTISAGNRPFMEDFHTTIRGFMEVTCGEFGGCAALCDADSVQEPVPLHYFGVFDGHRGNKASEYCANKLHYMVMEEWEKLDFGEIEMDWRERWKIALSKAYERVDEAVKDKPSIKPRFAGSTATVVLVSPCQIIASNCGNSMAIICRGKQVIALTVDHTPDDKEEPERIENISGKIIKRRGLRVQGVLSMTRAIGDHDLRPYVISMPYTTYVQRSDEDECLIIASDGLWNVMSTAEVAKVARKKLLEFRSRQSPSDPPSKPVAAVARELVCKALNRNSNNDNITVMVVDLKPLKMTNF